ncbi:M20/M25/M40 family metallo-hydrolase [Mesorhizobium sp. LCM 4577]|uniref:M20/M25/M40 family metallo-hydrolase n=1 Tax=Mesorhizobium sp. LCM 4577 TaxID=1848288 RepID=UPI0030833AC9
MFQPAEEAEPLGGRRVVAEGLLDDVDAAIGIHVDPSTATGKIAVGAGPHTLACDIFDITITGNSAHEAKPSVDAHCGGRLFGIADCTWPGAAVAVVARESRCASGNVGCRAKWSSVRCRFRHTFDG